MNEICMFILGCLFSGVIVQYLARRRAAVTNHLWVVAVARQEASRVAHMICDARVPVASERGTVNLKPGARPLPFDERYTHVFHRDHGGMADRPL